jgi:hypothetical protein
MASEERMTNTILKIKPCKASCKTQNNTFIILDPKNKQETLSEPLLARFLSLIPCLRNHGLQQVFLLNLF